VKWGDVCKPKREGGLRIRDLRLVNLSLLAKWRWKLLSEGEDVWKSLIVAKYGEHSLGKVSLEVHPSDRLCLSWWKDLCRLDYGSGWFNQVVLKKLGCGNLTSFWKDIWVGDQALEVHFPRLFSISVQKRMSYDKWAVG
jgi:hypothetical protein